MDDSLKDCFRSSSHLEDLGRKHKGLLLTAPDPALAQDYIRKAKANLSLCSLYLENGFDYKLPEEWFYTLYYCALAILARLGVESRSQRCTALFTRNLKDSGLIEYDEEFIDRITVHSLKDETSDVDERENARYGAMTSDETVRARSDHMAELCKRAIGQCERIAYSEREFALEFLKP